jgi:hypothetical protein
MAREPENVVLVMLREIRSKQDEHSERFDRIDTDLADIKKQLGSLGKVVTYSLGQSSEAQFRQSQQESRIDDLFEKVERLLADEETGR